MNAGRPRDFDEDTVLEQVMHSFWRSGFDQTTFEQLVADSGLSRSSLYNAFGGKEALFEKAIERYIENQFREFEHQLRDEEHGGKVLNGMLQFLGQPYDRRKKDCLLRKTLLHNAANADDSKEESRIEDYLGDLWTALEQAVSNSESQDEPEPLTNRERAAIVIALQFGSAVIARNGRNEELLQAMAQAVGKVVQGRQ